MNTERCRILFLLSFAASVVSARSQDPSADLRARSSVGSELIQEMVSQVSRDSLVSTIRALGDFQTRYEYTPQQDSAAEFLVRTAGRWGSVTSEWYTFGTSTIRDLALIDESTAWCVWPGSGPLRTTDGGATWVLVTNASTNYPYGVHFVNPNTGWIAGSGGLIAATTNGAAVSPTWIVQTSGTTATLYSVKFLDAKRGIVAGASGTIRRTTNGGALWSAPTVAGGAATLYDICISDSTHTWAVGNTGKILFSTDMGANWQTQVSGSMNTLYGVKFISPRTGWAVGAGPTLLNTTNGGLSWQNVPSPGQDALVLKSVDFADSLHGWIADATSCFVFRTSDGGATWQSSRLAIHTDWGPSLTCIRALNPDNVIVCGSRGILRRSTDGGSTWADLTGGLPGGLKHLTRNIVVTIDGYSKRAEECVMVAHYDSYSNTPTVAAPGANDNASGSSAVLEAARIMTKYRFGRTVKLVLVSGEELGMFGSSAYVERALAQGRLVVGAVNGDMIGYPTTADTARLVASSYIRRSPLVDSAVAYNDRYGIGLTLVTLLDSTGASDYSPFAIAGFPSLDLAEGTAEEIWGGADPYYHSTSDTWDHVHQGLVRRGAQLMLATVAELAEPLTRVDVSLPAPGLPSAVVLKPNYPNPFNPSTTIEFELNAHQQVVLEIVDVLGRRVQLLMNQECGAGTHRIRWDAANFAAGVYFARLRTGSFELVRPMLLVK
jgi:photosystem II stability/assembly factor-like uncharacterized protein